MEESYAVEFIQRVRRELRPLILPALAHSTNQEHFRDKMQLRAMYANINSMADAIAKEEVICRYKKIRTARHVRLCTEAEEAYENLRQLAVMFSLSY